MVGRGAGWRLVAHCIDHLNSSLPGMQRKSTNKMQSFSSFRTSWLLAISTAVAIGFVALSRTPWLPALTDAAGLVYEWIMLLAAVALLLGVVNVMRLHIQRIQLGLRDWELSLILLSVLAAVAVAGLLSPAGVASPLMEWLFDSLLAPAQAALFSLLAFFMAAAAFRYLRISRASGIWMLAGALLVLLLQMPMSSAWLPPAVANFAAWLISVPVMAAVRGLLLGSGVALLIVTLRLLVGRV